MAAVALWLHRQSLATVIVRENSLILDIQCARRNLTHLLFKVLFSTFVFVFKLTILYKIFGLCDIAARQHRVVPYFVNSVSNFEVLRSVIGKDERNIYEASFEIRH